VFGCFGLDKLGFFYSNDIYQVFFFFFAKIGEKIILFDISYTKINLQQINSTKKIHMKKI
jgi:hypothetical protein